MFVALITVCKTFVFENSSDFLRVIGCCKFSSLSFLLNFFFFGDDDATGCSGDFSSLLLVFFIEVAGFSFGADDLRPTLRFFSPRGWVSRLLSSFDFETGFLEGSGFSAVLV
eukprot:NODE_160_length_16633_cov_0.230132.p13 type:complete len:112 gc:universal NODE_160_length_16633_cov_0.230132:1633-1298(-)